MHTLQGSKLAADCRPDNSLQRTRHTLELDDLLASVFGLWDLVLDPKRRLHRVQTSQLELPPTPTARVKSKPAKKRPRKKTASAEQ